MPAFDTHFTPPAPVAEALVSNPVTGAASGRLRGQLDTGADLCVIPEELVTQLGLRARAHLWIRSYDGTFSQRPGYYERLVLEGNALPVVRCVAAERKNVLVGRNVLNRFHLTLDGKNLRFDLRPA